MFDDPKKELKKLEDQLLKDDEWLERELTAAHALLGDEPKKTGSAGKKPTNVRGSADMQYKAAKVVVRNTEDYDLDEPEAPRKSNRGLVILALLETLGIVALVVYWLWFLL